MTARWSSTKLASYRSLGFCFSNWLGLLVVLLVRFTFLIWGLRFLPINARYNNGITNKVSMVENANPHTMDDATGPQINDSPPNPVANENSPAIVVKEVIIIGITRRRAA